MSGAQAAYLSCGFILEEGTDLDVVGRVAQALGRGRERAGVAVVTGDTKVVDAGHGDGVYVNTAGIGLVPRRRRHPPAAGPARRRRDRQRRHRRARRGDHERARGPGVRHRGPQRLRAAERSGGRDARPVTRRTCTCCAIPTRGGLAASLNEIAAGASGSACEIVERAVPVPDAVAQRLRLPRPRPALRRQRGQAGGVRAAASTPTRCWPRCGPTRSGPGLASSASA